MYVKFSMIGCDWNGSEIYFESNNLICTRLIKLYGELICVIECSGEIIRCVYVWWLMIDDWWIT